MDEDLEAIWRVGDQWREKLAKITARLNRETEVSSGSPDVSGSEGEEEEDLEMLLEAAEQDAAAAREELQATKLRLQTVEEQRLADLQELERLRAEVAQLQQSASQATVPTPAASRPTPSPAAAQELRHLRNELEETQGKLLDVLKQKTSIEEAYKAQEEILQQLREQLQEARHTPAISQGDRDRVGEELLRLRSVLEGQPMMAQREEPPQEITQDELIAVYRQRSTLECERDSLLEVLEETRKAVREQLQETSRLEGELQETKLELVGILHEKRALEDAFKDTKKELLAILHREIGVTAAACIMQVQDCVLKQLKEQLQDGQQTHERALKAFAQTARSQAEELCSLRSELEEARWHAGTMQRAHANAMEEMTRLEGELQEAHREKNSLQLINDSTLQELQLMHSKITQLEEQIEDPHQHPPRSASSSAQESRVSFQAAAAILHQVAELSSSFEPLDFSGIPHQVEPAASRSASSTAPPAAAAAPLAYDSAAATDLETALGPEPSEQAAGVEVTQTSEEAAGFVAAQPHTPAASSSKRDVAPGDLPQTGQQPPPTAFGEEGVSSSAVGFFDAENGVPSNGTSGSQQPEPAAESAREEAFSFELLGELSEEMPVEPQQLEAAAAAHPSTPAPAADSNETESTEDAAGAPAEEAEEGTDPFAAEVPRLPQEPAAAAALFADDGATGSATELPSLPGGFATTANGLGRLFEEIAAGQQTEAEDFDFELEQPSPEADGDAAQEAEQVFPDAMAQSAPAVAAALFPDDGPPQEPSRQQLQTAVAPEPAALTEGDGLSSLFEESAGAVQMEAAPAEALPSGWAEAFELELPRPSEEATHEAEQAVPTGLAPSPPAEVAALLPDDDGEDGDFITGFALQLGGLPSEPTRQQLQAAVPSAPTMHNSPSDLRDGAGGVAASGTEAPLLTGGFATAADGLRSLFEEIAGARQTEASPAPASPYGWAEAFNFELALPSEEADGAPAQEAEPAVLHPVATALSAPAAASALFFSDGEDDFFAGFTTQPVGLPLEPSPQQLQGTVSPGPTALTGGVADSATEGPSLAGAFATVGNGLGSLFGEESPGAQQMEAASGPASLFGWGEELDFELDLPSEEASPTGLERLLD